MAEKPKQPNQPKNQDKKPKRSPLTWLYYAIMIGLLIFFFYPVGGEKGIDKDLSYTKFTAYVENDAVASVTVYDDNTAEAKIRRSEGTGAVNEVRRPFGSLRKSAIFSGRSG